MAQQESFIKLKGRIGDLTFYKTKGGYQARQKTGVDGKRIATDPSFQRTRENGAEFGRAGKASKLFRDALKPLIVGSKDSYMSNRLTKLMLKVVQADAINDRGLRMVLDAETEMLQGFEFNANALLSRVFIVDLKTEIDRAGGVFKVDLPAFDPKVFIAAPDGATHYQMKLAALSLDFTTGVKELDTQFSEPASIKDEVESASMVCSITANSTAPLFLVFGVDFSQHVNGKSYALNNGAFNALSIVQVSGI